MSRKKYTSNHINSCKSKEKRLFRKIHCYSFLPSTQSLLYSRLIHQIPKPTSKGPNANSTNLLSGNRVGGSDSSIANTAHRNTQRTDMKIQIFVLLVIIASDLNLSHTTNRQYLQRPLKPDRAPPNHTTQYGG